MRNSRSGSYRPWWRGGVVGGDIRIVHLMLLALLVGRHLSPLGMAVSMLIANTLSVATCQWVVMPPLMNALGPWLHANGADKRGLSLGGLALIWLFLGGLVMLFRVVTG